MFSLPVTDVMRQEQFVTASPATTVADAAKLMARENAGAVVVVEGNALLGIFTKRDAVYRVLAEGLDPQATPLSQAMTAQPRTVESTRLFGSALQIMSENGLRHLPVVENRRAIGIVTARNMFDPDLEEFVSEAQRRRYYAEP